MTLVMPLVRQTPTPNYTPSLIAHDLVILHMMEGSYAGSVAWLCEPRARASAHLCLKADGSEVTQLVPLQYKAWAQKAFNARGVSLEIEGFTAHGLSEDTLRAAAGVAAWLCRAYAIPPMWAQGGQGRGVCCHHDLGAAGGGHVDICGVGDATWMRMMAAVVQAYAALGDGALPGFALHGAPSPHQVVLPPSGPPAPSHGGAAHCEAGEAAAHATASGWPLASVGDWQWRLREVGANPQLSIDNHAGRATRAAVATFQRACGLKATGEADAATWARLAAATA